MLATDDVSMMLFIILLQTHAQCQCVVLSPHSLDLVDQSVLHIQVLWHQKEWMIQGTALYVQYLVFV